MNIKESIRTILEQNYTIESMMDCFELIKKNGDIIVIKFDGEREKDAYTVFITFPPSRNKQMIRTDSSDLKEAMKIVLEKYIED